METGESYVETNGTENTEAAGEAANAEQEAARKQAEETANQNKETVSMLLSTLRSGGWHIASNTFDKISYAASAELVREDAEKWNTVIAPLAGSTDMLLLPDGADIGEWSGYAETNERYTLLRDLGFRYFFVGNEETKTWAQVQSGYVRQSMHEVEEYAAYLSLMNTNNGAVPAGEGTAEDTATEELQTNGTLQLVGEALAE